MVLHYVRLPSPVKLTDGITSLDGKLTYHSLGSHHLKIYWPYIRKSIGRHGNDSNFMGIWDDEFASNYTLPSSNSRRELT